MSVFSMAGSNPALPTYPLQRSVRLRSSASAYFSRTPAAAGSQTTWTMSMWVKRGALGVRQFITMSGVNPNSSQVWQVEFDANNKLDFFNQTIGTYRRTTQVFRDVGAWYHIVFSADTNNATAQNRFRCWVNGVEVTAWDVNSTISSGYTFAYNGAYLHGIGAYTYSPSLYFDGYLEEINFIDGQALTPSSFGAFNSYGVWSPAKYTGSYGTNGFYLSFQDNSALTTTANVGIGADSSGNGNYWTSNNISLTAGVTYDSMLDVPTNTSPTNANYCTWNPVNVSGGGTTTITNGNLACSAGSTTTFSKILGTIGMSTGKWYWETTITAVGSLAIVGIGDGTPPNGSTGLGGAAGEVSYNSAGNKYTNAVSTAYGATYTTGDVIGVAYDADAGSITFYKNNTSQGTITGFSGTKYPAVGSGGGTNPQYAVNFGQQPFIYTPPTGFNRLNTYNLPDSIVPVGAQYFAATLYTSTGTTQSLTNTVNGVSFQPDFIWQKVRSVAGDNYLIDSVRGASNVLVSNTTAAAGSSPTFLTSFNSNGWTQGTGNYTAGVTVVGWQWKASNASAVTNTAGTISSQVSANQTAGFSIVTYTGTGANATVGHGLGVAPRFIMIKGRNTAYNWAAWHGSFTGLQRIFPNTTGAVASNATYWNSTTPTSSVFSLGSEATANDNLATFVAYCFAAVPGYSAFGSYTGNGSADGPFTYLGFRPRYVLIKGSSFVSNWFVIDTSRSTFNVSLDALRPNLDGAEVSSPTTTYSIDILSNGFKLRTNAADSNTSSATFIYAAFAENPFKNSLAR